MLVNALSILVGDVSTLLQLGFTHIEVWESKTYDAEPHEITAASAQPATLVSNTWKTFSGLAGLSLVIEVDGVQKTVDFSPALGDISASQLADIINNVIPGLAESDEESVTLYSTTSGRGSSLAIVFQPNNLFATTKSVGLDGRIALVSGTYFYSYQDAGGGVNSRYRWRFSNNGGQPISKFSEIVTAEATQFTSAALALATARFTSLDGHQQRTTVIVSCEAQKIGDYTIPASSKSFDTDETGFIQIPLVQGLTVTVAIEGTGMAKTFTVPSRASFDLLSVMGEAFDPFTVQTTQPLPTKRVL